MLEFPETSYSLIDQIKDISNGPAWKEFYAIYQPVVFRMARKRGMQDADAHDVIQQIFVSVSRSIQTWENTDDAPPFRAWLTTVARNAITKALDRMPKDVATGSTSVFKLLDAYPEDGSTSNELIRETRREIACWAMKQIRHEFNEDLWEIFQRTAIECVPIATLAIELGRSKGSIYVARFRVLARLKEKIRESSQYWDLGDPNHGN